MRNWREDTIFRISLGVLITIAVGLITGTAYIVTLSNASDVQGRRIEAVERKQSSIDEIQTDIAVMKQRLDSIDKKLDN